MRLGITIPFEPFNGKHFPELVRTADRCGYTDAWSYESYSTDAFAPIAAAATGMGSMMREWPWEVHLGLAVVTLLVNGWAFVVEYRCVETNAAVLYQVLNEVDRIRAERGLPTNAEALKQEQVS